MLAKEKELFGVNETEQMIKDCLRRQSKMTPWECNFMNNISKKKFSSLSESQLKLLDEIWEKVT
jgi:hypothetical protein